MIYGKKYPYNGGEKSVSELCDIYRDIHGVEITHQKMRYRLNNRGTTQEALFFESESEEQHKVLCDDGGERTYSEIADGLGISYITFMQRKSKHGLAVAIRMGGYGA